MKTIDEVVDDLANTAKVDFVSFPQIASAPRTYLGARTPDDVKKLSLDLVTRLYDRGLRPGNFPGGSFTRWPDAGCQAMLDRIEREWPATGEEPNLGAPICWFDLKRV